METIDDAVGAVMTVGLSPCLSHTSRYEFSINTEFVSRSAQLHVHTGVLISP